jgi:hypothetical protein
MFMVSGAVFCDFLPGQGLCKPIPARNGVFLSRRTAVVNLRRSIASRMARNNSRTSQN